MWNTKGYDIFVTTGDDDIYDYLTDAPHIQRIDDLNIFSSDLDACRQAEKDGIELIYFQNVGYLKTTENIDKMIARLNLIKSMLES